jgi:fibronectin type 3 domain-containing protein
VYRKDAGGGAFVRLNKELIQDNSWRDTTARVGKRYIYAVTAVDQSLRKNESALSDPVSILHLPQ